MSPEELATLYRDYGPTVLRRCRALLGTDDEAQDALQEVFVRALAQRERFRGEASPATWIYRIATNHCLNRLRDRKPLAAIEPDQLTTRARGGEQVEARQLLGQLASRLDRTSARIAVYHFLDSMPQEEIEEVMGISRRTIGKRITKIRELCRRLGLEEPARR